MENFQLYRTNILLGGQMKWDLILDTQGSNLVVSDFHISPININYPKYTEENLLNYPHQENLKKYYKEHEGLFYELNLDPRLSHDYTIVSDVKEEIYEDSFEAGPKNGLYQLYQKPFEVFCPLWLEYLNGDLQFELIMFTETGKKISSKTVKIDGTKFGDYFYNYIKYLGLDKGIDDVLDINFNTKKATITGIKLDSGNLIKQDISNIIPNLLYRERPMMEFDSMLMNLFKDNKIAVRQLFNFNFCFDANDLVSGHLADMLYGNKFNFKIITKINGKPLDERDFYSNYEFINKEDISLKTIKYFKSDNKNDNYNVLDYLYDYQYIHYMNKNKYVQSVIHWSLNDNPDYLFNLYNGFGPYDGENFYSHKYGNAPDLLNPIYNPYSNNIGWCTCININNVSEWMELVQLQNTELYEKVKNSATNFKNKWVNNIKYEYDKDVEWEELRLVSFIVNDEIFDNIISQINSGMFLNKYELDKEKKIYLINIKEIDGFYAIVTSKSNIDDITYVSFNKLLKKYIKDESLQNKQNDLLIFLSNKLNSAKSVPLISINKSLYIVNANSPSSKTTEIEYYKDDDALTKECYVLRYDGKIKPTFIDINKSLNSNIRYFKETINEQEFINSEFNNNSNLGFPPLYKSINYYAIKSDKVKYDKINKSLIMIIPEIEVDLYSENKYGVYKPIEDVIKNYIKNIYKIDDSIINHIYNMYNVEYSYDYKELDNLNDYIYHVKLILK